jgi:hypothetical protein
VPINNLASNLKRVYAIVSLIPEFGSRCWNLALKSGYANLQIRGLRDAIQENGIPGIARKQSLDERQCMILPCLESTLWKSTPPARGVGE